MCTKKSANYTAPKVDPAPTAVQAADVGTDTGMSTQKRRRGHASTELSTDRQTILGSLMGGNRTTLG